MKTQQPETEMVQEIPASIARYGKAHDGTSTCDNCWSLQHCKVVETDAGPMNLCPFCQEHLRGVVTAKRFSQKITAPSMDSRAKEPDPVRKAAQLMWGKKGELARRVKRFGEQDPRTLEARAAYEEAVKAFESR